MARWFRLGIAVSDPFGCRCLTGLAMLRFHIPLVEPDVRISRIRLSDRVPGCVQPGVPSAACVHQSGSRLSPIPVTRPLQTPPLNCGPFPLPALPGFIGTTSHSAIPDGPACPSRAASWKAPGLPPPGLPVLRRTSLCHACRRQYPGGTAGGSLASPAASAFPDGIAGRLPHYGFRGLLGVHSRCGLRAR